MVPLLTKYAARAAAVLLLLVGVVAGVRIGLTEDGPAVDPRQVAAEDLAETEQEQQSMWDWHLEYAATAATANAEDKAESIAEVAGDQAKALDQTFESNKEAAKTPAPGSVEIGPIPADCNEYSGNRGAGCARLLEAGFGLDQMPCLDSLWTKESGWNERAANPGSGAYGIPQALPGSKMASAGGDWEYNPNTQIVWGLSYISGRYGTPCDAWAHSQSVGWY